MSTHAAVSTNGVVIDRPDLRIVDTREMEWEDSDYLPGALKKRAAIDDEGEGIVLMRWLPAGKGPVRPSPSQGYHLAREFYLTIGGECPHWDFEPGEHDELVIFREGYYLDRQPGSVHGAGGEPRQVVDSKWVGWMTIGEDPLVGERESVALTESLPVAQAAANALPELGVAASEPDPEAVVHNRPGIGGAYVLDTRKLSWQPHTLLAGARQKVLSRTADGDPTVTIDAVFCGPYPAPSLPHRVRHDYRDFIYIIEGELNIREYESVDDTEGTAVLLKEGFFVDRQPGSIYGFDAGSASPTGATFLHFRARKDTLFVKESEKHRVWSRTLTPGIHKLSGGTAPTGVASKPPATEEDRQAFLNELRANAAR